MTKTFNNDCPLVSVIVPTYKRAEKIARSIESILNQDYPNIEVLVANDNTPGSSECDETNNRIAAFLVTGRLKILQTSGSTGGGAARNFACRQASGEYLAFLDDDDVFLPGKVANQLNFMLKHDLEMSYQDVEWHNEDGKLVELRKMDRVKEFSKEGLLRAHLVSPISPTAIYMLKKELFDRTEGFGETPTGQDWFLMLRCIEADGKIGYMPGSYVWQYLHDGRLSLGKNKLEGEKLIYEFKKQYYDILDSSERRYIDFRYHASLAVVCIRSKMPLKAIGHGILALAISPRDFINEAKRLFNKD